MDHVHDGMADGWTRNGVQSLGCISLVRLVSVRVIMGAIRMAKANARRF